MKKKLLKSTFIFSCMTAISRVTGLVREMVFAYYFGAGASMDAFNIAFRIPNLLRNLFAEGAFSQAFVPVLTEYREKKSQNELKSFINHIAGTLLTALTILTVIAILAAPWLVYVFAPGFVHGATRFTLTAIMLRITFPYILFISLTACASGILNAYGKFGIPAFAPNLLNLSLIGAAIFLAPHLANPIVALAWGVFIGGLAQLVLQLPFLYRLKLLPRPRVVWHDPGVRRVLKLMTASLLGVSVAQISFLVDNCIASFLVVGSPAWLGYSQRLTLLPLGVFGVAIATVILPHLSRKCATYSEQEFSETLDWALRFVLIIAIPAAISLVLLAGPIITTLFQIAGGKFSAFDVVMVRRSLLGFALGIPAFMLVKVLASGFYARQNVKTPVKIAVIALIANIMLALIFVFPLKHAGLALATSCTSTLNATLLFWYIQRNSHYSPGAGWGTFWLQLIFASFILIAFLWYTTTDLDVWMKWSNWERIWHLGLLCGGGGALYLSSLYLSGMRLKK